MLEIIALWALCRKIGQMVKAKGRKSGGYIALTIVLWIFGELVGAVMGALLTYNSDSRCLVYGIALLGAAVGAGIAYLIAKNVSPVAQPYQAPASLAEPYEILPPAEPAPGEAIQEEAAPQATSAFCTNCGYALNPGDKFCPSCGSAVP